MERFVFKARETRPLPPAAQRQKLAEQQAQAPAYKQLVLTLRSKKLK
jgi:hypothetical protein